MRFIPALALTWVFSTWLAAAAPTALPLPRSTPEAQGVASSAILRFIEASSQLDQLHSFMLVRHGQVIAEGWWTPYAANELHVLYSLSKSFTSTAVGLAVSEGRLSIDDPVVKFFPDEVPPQPSQNLRSMRVRDLLTMSTGHHADTLNDFPYFHPESAVKRFLELPVAHKPGTHFVYNTPATFMQSAIVQKLTGQSTMDYLRSRLFEPLGITSAWWEANPQGISIGGFGLNLTTEDIAKFGQLYLQKGQWQGKTLLPASWIEQASARQVSNGSDPASDWEQGYGFQFWRSKHGSYRADGAFGQYCFVLDKYDAVLAITSGTRDMAAVMNLVWDLILPALASDQPLPADAVAHGQLVAKLASLSVPTPAGQPTSSLAVQIAGNRYAFAPNAHGWESLIFQPGSTAPTDTFQLKIAGAEQTLTVGRGAWVKGELKSAAGTNAVAASGAWTADHRYVLKVMGYRTPFDTTYTLRFAGNELLVDSEMNVAFGERKSPQIIGKAE